MLAAFQKFTGLLFQKASKDINKFWYLRAIHRSSIFLTIIMTIEHKVNVRLTSCYKWAQCNSWEFESDVFLLEHDINHIVYMRICKQQRNNKGHH